MGRRPFSTRAWRGPSPSKKCYTFGHHPGRTGGNQADLFRTILVPHDFSAPATRALRLAAALARGRGRIVVLHVITPFPVTGLTPAELPYLPPANLAPETKKQLEALVLRTLGARRGVESRVVVGDPAARIVVAAARRATCVIMGTQGRTGLAHLLIGSVAEKVVRHSPRPVRTAVGRGHAQRIHREPTATLRSASSANPPSAQPRCDRLTRTARCRWGKRRPR
jgi:universal stress protein A